MTDYMKKNKDSSACQVSQYYHGLILCDIWNLLVQTPKVLQLPNLHVNQVDYLLTAIFQSHFTIKLIYIHVYSSCKLAFYI